MPVIPRLFFGLACLVMALPASAADRAIPYAEEARQAFTAWQEAGRPPSDSPLGEMLLQAAIDAGRPDLAESLLARGPVQRKMLPVPRRTQAVVLQPLRTFRQFHAALREEMFSSFQGDGGWLARRITANRIEVWTSRHGWLFDARGRLRHEARPMRRTGTGREWYGAFLPDGRWVTTDLDSMDGKLAFYSAAGKHLRTLTCGELAGLDEHRSKLLGWARSDKNGTGWVVSVGSEGGWATVWVAATGPARILERLERWKLCYPRALGPRGADVSTSVPDDDSQRGISHSEARHGPQVGFPTYALDLFLPAGEHGQGNYAYRELSSHVIPNGNLVFGFWPGAQRFFIGSDGNNVDTLHFFGVSSAKLVDFEPTGIRTRKYWGSPGERSPNPIIDKTWIGRCRGWARHALPRYGEWADYHIAARLKDPSGAPIHVG